MVSTSNHHHHIVLAARISLTLFRHSSLSFIALGRSSGQQPVSSHSCWMYVRAGRPAFARPCVGIHKSTSLMSSSLLLQQCPACLVRLTWIVFVIGATSNIPCYCYFSFSPRVQMQIWFGSSVPSAFSFLDGLDLSSDFQLFQCPLTKLLGTVLSAPNAISSLARSKSFSLFSFSLIFTPWSSKTAKSTIW